ncbi:MAG: pitrilysin family protein [Pseudomonadota bacterium]
MRISIVILLIFLFPTNVFSLEIKEWEMPNGLHVIFAPYRRLPAVTVQVWYHAGSKDERPGIRGVAHMFEHMMFKGTQHVRPEHHAQFLTALGGTINAFTTEDITAYHNTVPNQYFEFAVLLEAERMRNLLLTNKTIKSEREVVKEEKRLHLENSPIGRSLETIRALAYNKHPYRWTPAGDIPDLNRVTPADCQDFYNTFYVPNNASLIVVGDVTEEQVKEITNKYFGPIPKGKTPPRFAPNEPIQTEQRVQQGDWPSQLTVLLGAYHVPSANHQDIPAIRVLDSILSAGHSSRLHQALVRKKKLSLAAGSFLHSLEHPGLFYIYSLGLPIHEVQEIKDALLQEIEQIAKHAVTKEELSKAKNQLASRYLEGMKTIWGLANNIGMSVYLQGDPRAFLDMETKLDRVTVEDVERIAKTYLVPSNSSFVLVSGGIGGVK